jgi:hypothetical protein
MRRPSEHVTPSFGQNCCEDVSAPPSLFHVPTAVSIVNVGASRPTPATRLENAGNAEPERNLDGTQWQLRKIKPIVPNSVILGVYQFHSAISLATFTARRFFILVSDI